MHIIGLFSLMCRNIRKRTFRELPIHKNKKKGLKSL